MSGRSDTQSGDPLGADGAAGPRHVAVNIPAVARTTTTDDTFFDALTSSPFCDDDQLPTISEDNRGSTPNGLGIPANQQQPLQQQQQQHLRSPMGRVHGTRSATPAGSTGLSNHSMSDFIPLRATQSTSVLDLQRQLDKMMAAKPLAPKPMDMSAIGDDLGAKDASGNDFTDAGQGGLGTNLPPSTSGRKKVVHLRKVVQDAYEYHGLNDLGLYFIFAGITTLVLYFHWTGTTAAFKNTMQAGFQSYGNPDWQSQELKNVDSMYGGVEYITGFLEFNLRVSEIANYTNSRNRIRVGEYADIEFARLLVNLENNCRMNDKHQYHMDCYTKDPANPPYHPTYNPKDLPLLQWMSWAANNKSWANEKNLSWPNVENWNWVDVGKLDNRGSMLAGSSWLAYTIVAPKVDNATISTRANFMDRLHQITEQTSLNWQVPSNDTSNSSDPFSDVLPESCSTGGLISGWDTSGGWDSWPLAKCIREGQPIDLKPYLSRNAYSLVLDILASNVLASDSDKERDRAFFSLQIQRSDQPYKPPDSGVWQITTTVPARMAMYTFKPFDWVRLAFEIALIFGMIIITFYQGWQYKVSRMQWGDRTSPFWKQYWNISELVSTAILYIWLLYYVGLVVAVYLLNKGWNMAKWTIEGEANGGYPKTHPEFDDMQGFAQAYSGWLYMGIITDALMCLRIMRYMRIHSGLKAFYQVFVIAAREFADFAVFLVYILLVLGSAIFAFFQLTGGNDQFLRFSDGLSIMTRLTFGFVSYEDFQAQALGLGSAVAAVTFLFWVAVLLLVVYTQNIILAIVAEAYEEAKATLGTAEMSFMMLIFLRVVFTVVYIYYQAKMLLEDLGWNCWQAEDTAAVMDRDVQDGVQRYFTVTGVTDGMAPPPPPPGPRVSSNPFRRIRSLGVHKHDLRMYRQLLMLSQKIRSNSRLSGWARRHWAPWGVVRTKQVRSIMHLYQDFASYKLKTRPPWSKALDEAAALYPSAKALDILPDLDDVGGYLDEEQLTRLLHVLTLLQTTYEVWPPVFSRLNDKSNALVVKGIMTVYGELRDEGVASIASAKVGKDLKLGEGSQRDSTGGFIGRLVHVRHGTEGSALRVEHREQRRLEALIHRQSAVTQQNVDWLVTNLTNQREVLGTQAEVLKEVSAGMAKVSSQVDSINKMAEQAAASAAAAQQQAAAAAAMAAGTERGGNPGGTGSSSRQFSKSAGRRSRFTFTRGSSTISENAITNLGSSDGNDPSSPLHPLLDPNQPGTAAAAAAVETLVDHQTSTGAGTGGFLSSSWGSGEWAGAVATPFGTGARVSHAGSGGGGDGGEGRGGGEGDVGCQLQELRQQLEQQQQMMREQQQMMMKLMAMVQNKNKSEGE